MLYATKRLQMLEQALLGLGDGAMLLSELDGFVAGVVVCPEPIPTLEWLPLVWGEAGLFSMLGPEEQLKPVINAVLDHYQAVAATLEKQPQKYEPIFDTGENGKVLWEAWAKGFGWALPLRPEAWRTLFQDEDSDSAYTMRMMSTLVAIGRGPDGEELFADDPLSEEKIEGYGKAAPAIIPEAVRVLNICRKLNALGPVTAAERGPKVGRNDPCPCGSGKKYKKCCGGSY